MKVGKALCLLLQNYMHTLPLPPAVCSRRITCDIFKLVIIACMSCFM